MSKISEKELIEQFTSDELSSMLKKRKEMEADIALKDGEMDRKDSLSFLKGKKFIIERHRNVKCITLYEIDTDYEPLVFNENWVQVKLISKLDLKLADRGKSLGQRVDDEIRNNSEITYSTFDEFESEFKTTKKAKFKSFHPNKILSNLQEIDEVTYRIIQNSWEQVDTIVTSVFKLLDKK